jgi:tRNA G10  N-methylase Trm11
MPPPRPAGLPTVLRLQSAHGTELPPELAGDDVRFSDALVETFVDRLTAPGDVVFDPFAGFGTTLAVAERMGREAWGIELDPDRAGYARSVLGHPRRLIAGDARKPPTRAVPAVALSLSSPPYSAPGDPREALSAYAEPNPGYDAYLAGLASVYAHVAALLAPGGWIVIEASNLRRDGAVTALAWDIARAVSDVVPFRGEIVVEWAPPYGDGYDHSYCLLFQPSGPITRPL